VQEASLLYGDNPPPKGEGGPGEDAPPHLRGNGRPGELELSPASGVQGAVRAAAGACTWHAPP
jgi:hypothetical protein